MPHGRWASFDAIQISLELGYVFMLRGNIEEQDRSTAEETCKTTALKHVDGTLSVWLR